MGPDDNTFEIFSREYDRVYGTIEGPTPDGTIHTNIIPPIDNQTVITADRADHDGDWSHIFATPFIEYTGTGRLTTYEDGVRIQGLDLVDAVKQLSREEKRKVLELLLEGFDNITTEKPVVPKKVDHLRNLLSYSKKSTS